MRAMTATAILLASVLSVQAATPHRHVARPSVNQSCLARQRATLAPLDRYGGNLPPSAPALMQAIMGPILHTIRTRCLPTYHGPPTDVAPDPATIAPPPVTIGPDPATIAPPPPAYEPSANNPACPGSIC